ncbi:MAG: DUF1207 domain-containing protein [Parachlamydiaceae bacterium]
MQIRSYIPSLIFLSFLVGSFSLTADEGLYTSSPETPIELVATDESTDKVIGIWLPEDPVLFKPFVADPREVDYSVGWRFNDNALQVKNVIDVSFGDCITFYRWCNVGPWKGQLDISLEGALWAVFDPLHESSPLVNADYYVGVPITYAFGPWSFRLRGFHISSHIGDEFLLLHPYFKRKNPSAEYIDFFVSHYKDDIRLYGGLGVVVHMDESFKIGRFYAEAGAELHMSQFGFINLRDQVYGRPYYGMHFHFQTRHEEHIDQTYVLGYEWGKLCGLQRILRLFMEYHNGYSWEGQFFRYPSSYFSIRMSYGF